MAAPPDFIQRFIHDRSLISVRRKRVDGLWIQGFALGVSDKLLLMYHVYDFHLDGLMLLRLKDISDWKMSDTDVFQKRLLQEEGLLDQVDFDLHSPIDNYAAFLGSISKTELVIVESEKTNPENMLIGTVEGIDSKSVRVNYITGIARQLESPCEMLLRDVTSCQIGSNYLRFYQRHFERQQR